MAKLLRDKKTRANLEAVLGKGRVADIERLNRVFSAYSRKEMAEAQVRGVVRATPGESDKSKNIIYLPYDYIKVRLLSAAWASNTLSKVLNKSQNSDELFSQLFPALIGSKEGIAALTLESDKDPRFRKFINDYVADAPEANKK